MKRVLVANRGEVARRVLRACRDHGPETVVACSEADRDTLAVHHADQAVCIGPAQSMRSYLDVPRLLHGRHRTEALGRARRAPEEYRVEGVLTTLELHRGPLQNGDFQRGDVDTGWLQAHWPEGTDQ